jgi:trehalose 6-phosphate phosphatase
MSLGDLDELAIGAGDALFLDFDGVLAEIGPDPDAIRMPPNTETDIGRLAAALGGAVALLSGRDIRDLARRSPATVWRAGGHGLEVAGPGDPLPAAPPPPDAAVLAPLRALEAERRGVRVEIKGPVAALHYRAAPDAGEAALSAARKAAAAASGLVVQAGKMVVEVKPEAAHKGTALRRFAGRPPFAGRRPIMLGDDTTDEDAMAAAQELGGVGVKVGDGETVARLRTPDPAAVRAWLAREARRLDGRN